MTLVEEGAGTPKESPEMRCAIDRIGPGCLPYYDLRGSTLVYTEDDTIEPRGVYPSRFVCPLLTLEAIHPLVHPNDAKTAAKMPGRLYSNLVEQVQARIEGLRNAFATSRLALHSVALVFPWSAPVYVDVIPPNEDGYWGLEAEIRVGFLASEDHDGVLRGPDKFIIERASEFQPDPAWEKRRTPEAARVLAAALHEQLEHALFGCSQDQKAPCSPKN